MARKKGDLTGTRNYTGVAVDAALSSKFQRTIVQNYNGERAIKPTRCRGTDPTDFGFFAARQP